ncbi:MAG: choice-of-anchor B family protein [Flavobacteriales bacterium]
MKKYIFYFLLLSIPLNIFSQSSNNLNLVGSLNFPGTECNDIWGYVSNDGREYALVGLKNGFSVVDINDPSNPTEAFFISGAQSVWRDIKVWNNYAFVTADQGNDGLLIVDLEDLSGNTYVYTTVDNNGAFMCTQAHNIYIDEYGKAYLFGGNVGASGDSTSGDGALILDVTSVNITENDTSLPTILGLFDNFYLHDGMARGDTLWGSAIYEGKFFAIDVSNPSSPVIFNDSLAFHETPNAFTHNCWISDDGKSLFTTDEQSGAYIGSYDVSDLGNIQEIDRIKSSPEIGTVIPHNVHVDGNFLVTSYYRDGIVVHDISYPNHLVEVAHYDAYTGQGDGFDGSWGAYPYLPSNLILSSEINSGVDGEGLLLVLEPDYNPACYLKGVVTDSLNGNLLDNVSVRILTYFVLSTSSNLNGDYFIGIESPNTYDVEFSKEGYFTDTLQISFSSGVLATQNVALLPKFPFSKNGKVVNNLGVGISNAEISISSSFSRDTLFSDQNGFFSIDTLFQANYMVNVGKWGFKTKCDVLPLLNDSSEVLLVLDSAYYDDFTFDFGWQKTATASGGFWELGNPNATIFDNSIFNSSTDISSDCHSNAYVTGNAIGGGAGADDVDDGYVLLKSPIFDLTNYTNPAIKYYQWFANGGGWSSADDSMNVYLSNGQDEMLVSYVVGQIENEWIEKNINVSQFINKSSEMQFIVKVTDYSPNNHLTEGGIDGFEIYEDSINPVSLHQYNTINDFVLYPNPANTFINIPTNQIKYIYNSAGKLLLTSNKSFIDISDLTSGIYFVKMKNSYSRFIKL